MAQAANTAVTSERKFTTLASRKRSDTLTAYGFMAPALLVLVVFLIIPMLVALYFSLTNWNGVRPINSENAYQFIGFNNYQNLLISGRRVQDFYVSLKNTVYYVLGVVPTQTIIALVLAVILNQKWLKGRGFFRTAFYFPSITSSVVISLITAGLLFFSLERKHNFYLSFFVLPIALFAELLLLFEAPLLIAFYAYTFFASDFAPLEAFILLLTGIETDRGDGHEGALIAFLPRSEDFGGGGPRSGGGGEGRAPANVISLVQTV